MKRVLVTGGAGFIGSHLVERLLRDGARVDVLDNFDPFYGPEAKERNLAAAGAEPRFRLVRGDIRSPADLDRALAGGPVDVVVHLAAKAGVRPSLADPVGYASVNVDGTVQVLEACRRHGVSRLVFGSSSSVYGNNAKVPFAEDDRVDHPISPYAATKRAGELLCHAHHGVSGLHVACLRFFTVYGPRQRPDLAIHAFARTLLDGGEIAMFGDGASGRDYTYVDDIVEGIVRSMDRCRGFRIWNLGGSAPLPLSEMIRRIAAGLGVEPRIRREPPQPGDVERTWADVSRAREELGWEPTIPFDEGLERFLEWLRRDRSHANATGRNG
jgi:UDP-glucuronate 4-epimerase